MDLSSHNISGLFSQLGLPSTESEIDGFFATHAIPHDTRLEDADFWTSVQSDFLKEGIAGDSEWAEIIDQLDARLRH